MVLKLRCLVELLLSLCLWGKNLFLVPSHPLLVAPYFYYSNLLFHIFCFCYLLSSFLKNSNNYPGPMWLIQDKLPISNLVT